MAMDAFKAHFADDVAAMVIGHIGHIPAGCASKVQPLDLYINKSFKSILRECWEDHAVKVLKDAGDKANFNPSFKLSFLTRQDIVNSIDRGYIFLHESKTMIQSFFEVCGITNPGMDSDRTNDDDIFKDLFEN